jgi:hypothetical protein
LCREGREWRRRAAQGVAPALEGGSRKAESQSATVNKREGISSYPELGDKRKGPDGVGFHCCLSGF